MVSGITQMVAQPPHPPPATRGHAHIPSALEKSDIRTLSFMPLNGYNLGLTVVSTVAVKKC